MSNILIRASRAAKIRLPASSFLAVASLLLLAPVTRSEESKPTEHLPESASAASSSLVLVKEGVSNAVVVLSDKSLLSTAEYFVKTVERSTNAAIPILDEAAAAKLPSTIVRIYVGLMHRSDGTEIRESDLPEEGYQILSEENAIYIQGRDSKENNFPRIRPYSMPTRWALNSILEKQLGVRWLWPGELGTYVPKHTTFVLPQLNIRYQPKLVKRSLWIPLKYTETNTGTTELRRIEQEAYDWAQNHQAGKRGDIPFGHAFGHWWKKYGKEHPDYFAETPPGFKHPYPRAERVKLRLANPAVIEQIAQEYTSAGAPPFWNVCPNDGSFFDISEETRKWDLPENQSVESIWGAKANLTARYVEFWNRLYTRLQAINPDVILCTYAYSAYKSPPTPERPLLAKMAIGLVPIYYDYDQWNGWSAYNTQVFIRPNWWHYGANAPYLPLKECADFFDFIWKHGLSGIDMDSITGYWATQGPNYYLVARLMTRPDLTVEDILTEYTSAFGAAAPKILEYLAYWQKLSSEYKFGAPDGKFAALIQEGKIAAGVSGRSSRHALPYLYSEEIVAPAYALLTEAQKLVADSDIEALERVKFLKAGLDELRATRELVTLSGRAKTNPSSAALTEFKRQSLVVEKLRHELSVNHVVWGDAITREEDRRGVYIEPRAIVAPASQ